MSDDTRDESDNVGEASASDADGSAAARPLSEDGFLEDAVAEESPSGEPEAGDEGQAAAESGVSEVEGSTEAAPESGEPEQPAVDEVDEDSGSDDAGETTPADAQAADEDAPAAGEDAQGDDEDASKNWYILKVQNNREDSIRAALLRRMKIAELEEYFSEVIVPTETVSEYKNGKRRSRKKKIWPGYIIVHMEINEDTWFLVRETPGIGDFTGAGGKPTPMEPDEVAKVLALVRPDESKGAQEAPVVIGFNVGDKVKIKDGTFQNFEGEVEGVNSASGRVTVMTTIFGRPTPVELEYWQIESV